MESFCELNPVVQALIATIGTWGVTAEELIPESQRKGNVDPATMGVIVGFAIMMTLDVALG